MLELARLEREAVVRLSKLMPKWQENLGPGLDASFAALRAMLICIDKAVGPLEKAGASAEEISRRAIAEMTRRMVDTPEVPGVIKTQRKLRNKALGNAEALKTHCAYEIKTVRLLADDFPAWYDEVGLSGFFSSLVQLTEVFEQEFDPLLEDRTLATDKLLFLAAFRMRERFGKIEPALLEALAVNAADLAPA